MRIVILMGGTGSRFAAVGYQKPKPLLHVGGKAMVEHVVAMYPGTHEFIFVCNEQFARDPVIQSLKKQHHGSKIVPIPSHKLGPLHSLSFIWKLLPDDEPVMVSYCDFNAAWDFQDFAKKAGAGDVDGAIPCYTGFHPHLIHRKKYAGVLADQAGFMKKIREKHCFTKNPEDSFHSAGNYYFSRAGELKRYAEALSQNQKPIHGEYYLSMIYYHYLADKKRILVYPLTHFMQWGTPEDLEEYEAWSHKIQGPGKGVTDIPDHRRKHVAIPHKTGSRNFARSASYWRKYFAR